VRSRLKPTPANREEKADHPFQLLTLAVGDRGADDDVILSRVSGEQHREGGQQGHVKGRSGLLARAVLAVDLSALHRRSFSDCSGRDPKRHSGIDGLFADA